MHQYKFIRQSIFFANTRFEDKVLLKVTDRIRLSSHRSRKTYPAPYHLISRCIFKSAVPKSIIRIGLQLTMARWNCGGVADHRFSHRQDEIFGILKKIHGIFATFWNFFPKYIFFHLLIYMSNQLDAGPVLRIPLLRKHEVLVTAV